jgi:hypothetical protein
MAVRRRRGSTAALALTAALSVGSTLLLTACGPGGTSQAKPGGETRPAASATPSGKGAAPTPSAGHSNTPAGGGATPHGTATPSGTTAPTRSAAPTGTATASAPTTPTRGTGAPHLTISNGTEFVQMENAVVDFHTPVRDLTWAPDDTMVAFVNGNGDLAIAKPDGTGQIVVARNPGGQTWSHPTWVMEMPDPQIGIPHRNTIIFTADQGGTTKLMQVRGDAANATPTALPIDAALGDAPVPQAGNTWANAGGPHGTITYANTADGSVYIRDDYTREQAYKITEGSEPALSPDAHELVFVRSTGVHDHVFELALDHPNSTPQDMTPQATTDYTEPAFSPDGREVTFRTPTGTATVPADGSLLPHPGAYTEPGLPAYRF